MLGYAEVQKLVATDGAAGDQFGSAVDIHGSILAVGAVADNAHQGMYPWLTALGTHKPMINQFK